MASTQEIAKYNSTIITTAMKQGLPERIAKYIASQAAWETGNFKSNNFLNNNNAFGMAVPRVRKSRYILGAGNVNAPAGEGGFAYARYASLQDSVKDLIDWLRYNNINWEEITSPETYDAFLTKKGYHTASQDSYTAGLIFYYNKIKDIAYKNPKTTLLLAGAGALIIAGAILYFKRKKLVA